MSHSLAGFSIDNLARNNHCLTRDHSPKGIEILLGQVSVEVATGKAGNKGCKTKTQSTISALHSEIVEEIAGGFDILSILPMYLTMISTGSAELHLLGKSIQGRVHHYLASVYIGDLSSTAQTEEETMNKWGLGLLWQVVVRLSKLVQVFAK